MLSDLRKQFNSICTPSQIYVFISIVSLLAILVQNISNTRKYCVGLYECDLTFSNVFIFAFKLAYIAVWTIILNSLCKAGYKNLAWFFVLVPIVLLFVLMGAFMFVTANKLL
jgi:hypothetical protein